MTSIKPKIPLEFDGKQKDALNGDTRFLRILEVIGLITDSITKQVLEIQKKRSQEGKKHYMVGEILTLAKQPVLKPGETESVLALQKKLRESQPKDDPSSISFDPALLDVDEWKKKLYTGKENRIQKRIAAEKISSDPISIKCSCDSPKQTFAAILKDFSSSGMQIQTDRAKEFKSGNLLSLNFEIEKISYQVKAVVLNIRKNSIGVAFKDLTPFMQKRLEILVGDITLSNWAMKHDH